MKVIDSLSAQIRSAMQTQIDRDGRMLDRYVRRSGASKRTITRFLEGHPVHLKHSSFDVLAMLTGVFPASSPTVVCSLHQDAFLWDRDPDLRRRFRRFSNYLLQRSMVRTLLEQIARAECTTVDNANA